MPQFTRAKKALVYGDDPNYRPSEGAKARKRQEDIDIARRINPLQYRDWGPQPEAEGAEPGTVEQLPGGGEYRPAEDPYGDRGHRKYSDRPEDAGDPTVGYFQEKIPARAPDYSKDKVSDFSPENWEKMRSHVIDSKFGGQDLTTANISQIAQDQMWEMGENPFGSPESTKRYNAMVKNLKDQRDEQESVIKVFKDGWDARKARAVNLEKQKRIRSEKAVTDRREALKLHNNLVNKNIELAGKMSELTQITSTEGMPEEETKSAMEQLRQINDAMKTNLVEIEKLRGRYRFGESTQKGPDAVETSKGMAKSHLSTDEKKFRMADIRRRFREKAITKEQADEERKAAGITDDDIASWMGVAAKPEKPEQKKFAPKKEMPKEEAVPLTKTEKEMKETVEKVKGVAKKAITKTRNIREGITSGKRPKYGPKPPAKKGPSKTETEMKKTVDKVKGAIKDVLTKTKGPRVSLKKLTEGPAKEEIKKAIVKAAPEAKAAVYSKEDFDKWFKKAEEESDSFTDFLENLSTSMADKLDKIANIKPPGFE